MRSQISWHTPFKACLMGDFLNAHNLRFRRRWKGSSRVECISLVTHLFLLKNSSRIYKWQREHVATINDPVSLIEPSLFWLIQLRLYEIIGFVIFSPYNYINWSFYVSDFTTIVKSNYFCTVLYNAVLQSQNYLFRLRLRLRLHLCSQFRLRLQLQLLPYITT